MRVKIVIPIYNALSEVKVCLESLSSNLNFDIASVLCIDDCSDSATAEFVKDFCKRENFEYLKNDENLGFIKTCNRGLKLSNEDIVVLLNSDTQIPKNFAEKIIKCFKSDSNIGVASPIATYSGTYFISLPNGYDINKINFLLDCKHSAKYPEILNAEGFCFCIRNSVIKKIGFLDEIYGFGYCEEVDYSNRAVKTGFRAVLIDDLYVYHKRHCSFGKERRNIQIETNQVVYNERWANFVAGRRKVLQSNPCRSIERKIFAGTPIRFLRYDDKFVFYIFKIRFSFKIK